jgi:hypothetical protein
MMMRPLIVAALLAFVSTPCFAAGPKVQEIRVASSRVSVGDVVLGLGPEAAGIDLGPAPAMGGSRVIDREEIVRVLHDHDIDDAEHVPASVRVLRKTKRVEPTDIELLVRQGVTSKLTRGVTLSAVHPGRAIDVPDGFTRVTVDLPRPPRRTGPVSSAVSLVFFEQSEALLMISVPVDLTLSEEAAIPDLVHGARVTLVVRRGLVEVTSSGTAGADADIGGILPVVLHPSGRVVRARLEDPEHAVALDSP